MAKQKQAFARQAITTKYHGPTDLTGSRVSATCEAGRVVVHWDHALDIFENHRMAMEHLTIKLNWAGRRWVGGAIKTGYVFVDTSVIDGTEGTEGGGK